MVMRDRHRSHGNRGMPCRSRARWCERLRVLELADAGSHGATIRELDSARRSWREPPSAGIRDNGMDAMLIIYTEGSRGPTASTAQATEAAMKN